MQKHTALFYAEEKESPINFYYRFCVKFLLMLLLITSEGSPRLLDSVSTVKNGYSL